MASILPPLSDCVYTSCYCEENVWKLCSWLDTTRKEELNKCYVVFVSNEKRAVPLWRQKCGRDEDKLVIWDYHCILLYNPDDRCVVYDLNSELPFPTYFHKYVTETFRTDHILEPENFRYFRVVPAPIFFEIFSSDREHMKNADGSWKHPPPSYPPIIQSGKGNNLEDLINMTPKKGHGEVMNLTDFVKRFYKP